MLAQLNTQKIWSCRWKLGASGTSVWSEDTASESTEIRGGGIYPSSMLGRGCLVQPESTSQCYHERTCIASLRQPSCEILNALLALQHADAARLKIGSCLITY